MVRKLTGQWRSMYRCTTALVYVRPCTPVCAALPATPLLWLQHSGHICGLIPRSNTRDWPLTSVASSQVALQAAYCIHIHYLPAQYNAEQLDCDTLALIHKQGVHAYPMIGLVHRLIHGTRLVQLDKNISSIEERSREGARAYPSLQGACVHGPVCIGARVCTVTRSSEPH